MINNVIMLNVVLIRNYAHYESHFYNVKIILISCMISWNKKLQVINGIYYESKY